MSAHLCKDCKWVALHNGNPHENSDCTSPNLERSLIDGEIIRLPCRIARDDLMCGVAGRWFQLKEYRIIEKVGPMKTVEWWR